MFKTKTVEEARAIAAHKELFYGWSVFSPGWFVGTREQLEKCGVHTPVRGYEPRDTL
jgi:hypothetical protein